QGPHEPLVDDQRRVPKPRGERAVGGFGHVRARRDDLQADAAPEREPAPLAQTEPENRRALERPGGGRPAGVERERDRERRGRYRERDERLDERPQHGPPPKRG